jgi:hypothetical protein
MAQSPLMSDVVSAADLSFDQWVESTGWIKLLHVFIYLGRKHHLQRPEDVWSSESYLLHVRSEDRMVFTGFRVAAKVFRAKIRSQHAVRRHSAEVDALFQLNLEEFPAILRDYGKS